MVANVKRRKGRDHAENRPTFSTLIQSHTPSSLRVGEYERTKPSSNRKRSVPLVSHRALDRQGEDPYLTPRVSHRGSGRVIVVDPSTDFTFTGRGGG